MKKQGYCSNYGENDMADERKDNKRHLSNRARLPASLVIDLEEKKKQYWDKDQAQEKKDENTVKNLIHSSTTYFSHSYLSRLSDEYHTIEMDNAILDSKKDRIRLFEITRWVKDAEENSIDKLANFYQTFSKTSCGVSLIIHRTEEGCKFFFAVSNLLENAQPSTANSLVKMAKESLQGNFPGMVVADYDIDAGINTIDDLLANKDKYVASVSSLASEKSEKFISQTIEKLLDGMVPRHGKDDYLIMLLAEPVFDFEEKERILANTYTALSPHKDVLLSNGMSESSTIASTATRGVSAGVGGGCPFVHAHVDGHWDSSISDTQSQGKTKGKSVTVTNFDVKYVMDLLEKTNERLEQCKATGMWNFAAYIISHDEPMAKRVANMYVSLIQGEKSYLEDSAINLWKDESAENVLNHLSCLLHPTFSLKNGIDENNVYLPSVTDATNLLSTIELAHAMNFPRKSVTGFPVTECAAFGRSVSLLDDRTNSANGTEVGDIWHMRKKDGGKVVLDTNLLTSHVFITGSTGSGKSNTVYQLLNKLCPEIDKHDQDECHKNHKHFLVIEPAKGEYKDVFGGREDVTVYGTNCKETQLLKINPFSFPDGTPLYAHIDRLLDIFNACWPMYAAMPAILKDAIIRSYKDAGWDLESSENKEYPGLFPTFVDVLRNIDIIMKESDYSGDSQSDYRGALKTRVKELTDGVYGIIFGCDEIDDADLFDKNVIVDLSDIGPMSKSLAMGMLVLKLQEYRKANASKANAELKHIVVLEEAHNLLKRTSTEQSSEISNLVGKSVEMITNAIAEMRTYGECFMIVDQAPGLLDPAAIRNTNTKIAMYLPDYSDRELVGKAIGLNDNQIVELGRLKTGVGAVYQKGWIEAVLCSFKEFKKEDKKPLGNDPEEIQPDKTASILMRSVLLGKQNSDIANAVYALKRKIITSKLPVTVKHTVLDICNSKRDVTEEDLASIAYDLFDADSIYSNGKELNELKLKHQILVTRQTYQISERTMDQNDFEQVQRFIEQEHVRRADRWMNSTVTGGIF